MFDPSKGGSSLAQQFLSNTATKPAPAPQIGMGGQAGPITQPQPFPLPVLGSLAPQVSAPLGPAGAPAGFEDVSGQRMPMRRGNRAQQEFGMLNPAPIEAYKAAAQTDNPFQFAQGTFRSIHNPGHYLIPGQPGYPGSSVGAAATQAAPQLSQAQLLARAINEQAQMRGR